MPRYEYSCLNCGIFTVHFHSMKDEDVVKDCISCGGVNTMQKVFKNFYSNTKQDSDKKQKVGELTKQYIEKNKKLLDQQKKEAMREEYE